MIPSEIKSGVWNTCPLGVWCTMDACYTAGEREKDKTRTGRTKS